MKNNKLVYKISAGLGMLALIVGVGFATWFSPANAQTNNANPNGNFNGMMGNIPNSSQFYKEMSDLMKKYNVNCPMLGNDGDENNTNQGATSGNFQGAGMMGGITNSDQFYQDMSNLMAKYNINPDNYKGPGYGMMGGGYGGMMNFR